VNYNDCLGYNLGYCTLKCANTEPCKNFKKIDEYRQRLSRAKSEAHEEFAETLKEHFDDYSDYGSDETFYIHSVIDDVLNSLQCSLKNASKED